MPKNLPSAGRQWKEIFRGNKKEMGQGKKSSE
jgi:Sec-independent protein translocase protein TatA